MSSSTARPSWRVFFGKPHVLAFLALAMLARLSYATVGFAVLLLLEQVTGSYAVAGAGLVAYSLTGALLAPLRGRFVDRQGRQRALPVLAVLSALLFVACALLAAPLSDLPVALVALTGLSGCFLPPLGPVTRGVWADVAADADERRVAYSADTVGEEGLFTVGPLLVGLVVALTSPRAALLLTAIVMLGGTMFMVRSRLLSIVSTASGHEADEAAAATSGKGLLDGRFLLLMGVTFGAGLGLGGLELAMVAFSDQLAGPAQTGALLAALSLGSALGGALYGTRDWSGTAFRHLVACCLALGLGLGLLALLSRSTGLLGFATVGFLLGLFVAPLIVALYTCADYLATAGTRTQASTLVGTLNNLGTAAGTAATGVLIDTSSVSQALLLGAGALLATGLVALRLPVLRPRGANST